MLKPLSLSLITLLFALGLLATGSDGQVTFMMSGGGQSAAAAPAFAFQAFFPSNISLAVGDTLTITNKLERAAVYVVSRTATPMVSLVSSSSSLQLSNATMASTNATGSFNSSGIIMTGQSFSWKVVTAGTYFVTDIASPSTMMTATVTVTATAAAARPTPADVSTAANASIALLSTQATALIPTSLPTGIVTAGLTRMVNTTSAELQGFFPLNVTTSASTGITIVANSSDPVQSIVISTKKLTFTSTSFVVKCSDSNTTSCLNSTIFMASTFNTSSSLFSTGLFQGPKNFTAPQDLLDAVSPNSTVFVYLMQFFASYELPVQLSAENAPTSSPAPVAQPQAIPGGGTPPTPSSSSTLAVMCLTMVLCLVAFLL